MEPVVSPQGASSYVDFLSFRLDPTFRRLPANERAGVREEFLSRIGEVTAVEVRPYLTLGFRADCDFLLWLIAKELDAFQRIVGLILSTRLGRYLEIRHAWTGMTKPSPYFKGHKQHFEMGPATAKYVFIYPFSKSHAWYQLPFDRRRAMMAVHNEVGHQFPGVTINTCYQFGLGDHDFLLAFECDDPKEFSDLVQKLRETEARVYTTTDIPLIPAVRHTLGEVLDALALQ